MRLPDLPNLPNRDVELSAEIERELDAIERALAGGTPDADPELAALMALATEIREQRPTPSEDFSAELDRLAATGFRSAGRSPLERLRTRFIGHSPLRIAAPAGAFATVLIAAVVTVSVLNDGSSVAPSAVEDGFSGTGESSISAEGTISADETTLVPLEKGAVVADDALGVGPSRSSAEARDIRLDSSAAIVPPFPGQQLAPGQEKRQVDRDAFLTLSTKPEDVREATDKAVAIVRGFGGIIASSQVTEGTDGASSLIEIALPTRNLDAALDQLTELGNVESLNEATVDITKPFVSAKERIRDARAERRSILDALSVATDPETITELKRQANKARLEISRAKADFDNIARQARLSNISLEIVGDPDAADDWSISDALEDAKDVLRTAAGIALVTGAILVPLALLVLLFALGLRTIRGGRRERTLDDS